MRRCQHAVVLVFLGWMGLLELACHKQAERPAVTRRLAEAAAVPGSVQQAALPMDPRTTGTPGGALFEKLDPAACGIAFRHQWKPRDRYEEILLRTGFSGGGVALGDYDRDGRCDLLFTRPHGGARLYRNLGAFHFEDTTQSAGLESPADWSTGATWADVNHDGWPDLFLCGHLTPNRLYLNQGNGAFRDATMEAGLSFTGASIKLVFADMDRDGDLDAYLVTNRKEPKERPNIRYLGGPGNYRVADEDRDLAGVITLPNGEQKFVKAGQADLLYRNELKETGRLHFVDISEQAGIAGHFHGLDAMWWDYDGDGYPDLYVANDFTDPDHLYHNQGDGTFRDVSVSALSHTPWSTMGCAVGDYNRDGRPDLFVTDMAGTTHAREIIRMASQAAMGWFLEAIEPPQYMRNALFINTGAGRFLETARLAGVAASDWTWSAKAADLDEDGWVDLFVSNGFTRDYLNIDFIQDLQRRGLSETPEAWRDSSPLRERNIAFRNLGDLQFTNTAAAWGLDELDIGFGAGLADLDGDGDLDLVINNFDGAPSLYRNQSRAHHRLKLRLRGVTSHPDGIGCAVRIETESGVSWHQVSVGNGYLSCDEPLVYCGLGTNRTVRQLTIDWPSGRRQRLRDLPADQYYTITEPAADAGSDTNLPGMNPTQDHSTYFARREILPPGAFVAPAKGRAPLPLQPLLPHSMARFGPALAQGDVDDDGDLDLFLGGEAGRAGRLLLQEPGPGWKAVALPAFDEDAEADDSGAVFLDVDQDGDLDLYVVSGGVAVAQGEEPLRDRLYLNEGTPTGGVPAFHRALEAVPDFRESGSVAAAADFDRDGDQDLFVGGRIIPGQYPLAPPSRLLRNEGGRFVDATDELTPSLLDAGIVTGAVWSDADRDGWPDLLLSVDHGPVRYLHNQRGKLIDATAEAGLSQWLGSWQGIAEGDLDGDGDMDYAVGNLGLNTDSIASPDRPEVLLYGDFDGGGRSLILEAVSTSQGLMPLRSREAMLQAMPFLQETFPTYHQFGEATLEDMIASNQLAQARRREMNTLETGVLINDGTGRFTFQPLPRLAQVAPVFGLTFLDADKDGQLDLFLTQNFQGFHRETGRLNGGVSLLLQGDGSSSFAPVWPDRSGLAIAQEARTVFALDINGDGRKDLVVALRDGSLMTFLAQASHAP